MNGVNVRDGEDLVVTWVAPTCAGGDNMNEFYKFVAETYPETEDYLTVWNFVRVGMTDKVAFMQIRDGSQYVLECAKAWKEMEDEDE